MRFSATLTGVSGLLMHADDVIKADELARFRKDPSNKTVGVAGDDRSPAWTWTSYLYYGKNAKGVPVVSFPQTNLAAMLREAGAQVKLKGNTTFKSLTQSGILLEQTMFPFLVNGKEITAESIADLAGIGDPENSPTFEAQQASLEKLTGGAATIDVRRAAVGSSKHVRCRPLFETWSIIVTGEAVDPALTLDVLATIFNIGGRLKGLGDWRPSARKPGPYGRFVCEVSELK